MYLGQFLVIARREQKFVLHAKTEDIQTLGILRNHSKLVSRTNIPGSVLHKEVIEVFNEDSDRFMHIVI